MGRGRRDRIGLPVLLLLMLFMLLLLVAVLVDKADVVLVGAGDVRGLLGLLPPLMLLLRDPPVLGEFGTTCCRATGLAMRAPFAGLELQEDIEALRCFGRLSSIDF